MEEWKYISDKVDSVLGEIFKFQSVQSLSDYEKRKYIFDYLTKKLIYDFDTLDDIKQAQRGTKSVRRNPTQELLSVVNTNHGICNGISQYYKLLLERIGIKSHCVVCDDGTEVNHQILLVYNQDTDTYSFDDVTSVVVGRGTKEEYFDYEVSQANRFGQGNKRIYEDREFVVLPEEYINFVVKRRQSPTKTLEDLPTNIKSVKAKGTVK